MCFTLHVSPTEGLGWERGGGWGASEAERRCAAGERFVHKGSVKGKGFARARNCTHASVVCFFGISFMAHVYPKMLIPKMLICRMGEIKRYLTNKT